MDKKENKVLSILANLDIALAAVILAVLIVLTFAGVIWRYIFNGVRSLIIVSPDSANRVDMNLKMSKKRIVH